LVKALRAHLVATCQVGFGAAQRTLVLEAPQSGQQVLLWRRPGSEVVVFEPDRCVVPDGGERQRQTMPYFNPSVPGLTRLCDFFIFCAQDDDPRSLHVILVELKRSSNQVEPGSLQIANGQMLSRYLLRQVCHHTDQTPPALTMSAVTLVQPGVGRRPVEALKNTGTAGGCVYRSPSRQDVLLLRRATLAAEQGYAVEFFCTPGRPEPLGY